MINVSLENETDWIIKGTITSDVEEIDLEGADFRIEIKDLLEHYIKRKTTDEVIRSFQFDTEPTLTISNREKRKVNVPAWAILFQYYTSPQVVKSYDYVQQTVEYTSNPDEALLFNSVDVAQTVIDRLGLTNTASPFHEGTYWDGTSTKEISFYATTVCGGSKQILQTEEFYSNVNLYNNSDMKSLIENGFQFWIRDDKKTLEFRVTARGQSTLNPDGYFDEVTQEYSGRVGISMGHCVISLDKDHLIKFDISLLPKLKSSDIFRMDVNKPDHQVPLKPYKKCPICGGTGTIVVDTTCPACGGSNGENTYGQDRYGFPYYNSEKTKDMLYVNNNSSSYSALYYTEWDKDHYVTPAPVTGDARLTPKYAALTSAYIPTYLVTGETIDLLDEEHSLKARGFEFCFDEGVVSSYLLSDDRKRKCELDWYWDDYTVENFKYVEANGECISGDMNLQLITQEIYVKDSKDIEGKTVFFGTEV